MAAKALRAMIQRIGLAAEGANADGAHVAMSQKNLVHLHALHQAVELAAVDEETKKFIRMLR